MESFNSLKKIYNEVKQAADLSKMLLYVVGNKNDQYEHEQVKKDIALQYSKSINATYRCVSALKSEGINELFDYIGRSFFIKDNKDPNQQKESEESNNKDTSIKLDQKKTKPKKKIVVNILKLNNYNINYRLIFIVISLR